MHPLVVSSLMHNGNGEQFLQAIARTARFGVVESVSVKRNLVSKHLLRNVAANLGGSPPMLD